MGCNQGGSHLLIKKGQTLEDLKKLRDLATWYREFAEKAGSTTIWDARLRTAEDLDQEIARQESLGLNFRAHRQTKNALRSPPVLTIGFARIALGHGASEGPGG
jgi:hypothetical protein